MRFTYRVAGVAINDGKILLQTAVQEGYWFLPGGRAELQETAEETLKREMHEELQTAITVERLLWVVENFFEHGGQVFHELGLYFLMSFPHDALVLRAEQSFFVEEASKDFIFQWRPLESLKELLLYPSFLQSALQELPPGTEHIVQIDLEPERR